MGLCPDQMVMGEYAGRCDWGACQRRRFKRLKERSRVLKPK